jgi:hypothetical protein
MAQDNMEAPGTPTATWVIDGLEGHLARVELEDGETVDLSLSSLPPGAREGDVIRVFEDGGDFTLEIDHAETARRRAGAQAQLDALNRAAPAGEIDL